MNFTDGFSPDAVGTGALIWRRLFCSGGYGVHSPFVFGYIGSVIGERCPYYFYSELAEARRRLFHPETAVSGANRRADVLKTLRRQAPGRRETELLFRVANRCKARSVLTIGSGAGLAPPSLCGHAADARCIALECERDVADAARAVFPPATRDRIELRTGDYACTFAAALDALPQIDCLFMGGEVEADALAGFFAQSLPRMHGASVCIVAGIHAAPARLGLWRRLCAHPAVTVTLDLYSLGLVFFLPKLHRRTYKCGLR